MKRISPLSHRRVLVMHYWDGYSFEEIASIQGKSVKAIYHLHRRALKNARRIASRLGLVEDRQKPKTRQRQKVPP